MSEPLELRLLGPTVSRVALPKGKPLVLLATLAAYAGVPVGIERLVGFVWPEDPPANGRATVQTYVMRLRRALGEDAIVTVGRGYVLRIPPERIDIGRFSALCERAARQRAAGDTAAERTALREAIGLWRGEVFADIDSPTLRAEVGGELAEQWNGAFERAVEIELENGAGEAVLGELRASIARYPLRESLWVLLLRALRDANRRAEALAEFHRVRSILDSELGVLPGKELAACYQELLVESPGRSSTVRQLPRVLPDFAGRGQELDAVTEVVSGGANLVVIWGMAGIGKSTLATSAAHAVRERYPDGQWYVNLGGGTPAPLSVEDALAELLMSGGVEVTAIPPSGAARAALFRSLTAGRKALLLLDNVRETAQILALLPGTGESLVLVTSRSALPALPGAERIRLAPLDEDNSVAVLSELIGADRVSAEPGPARELARLCGGLPLALRILGTRLQPMPEVPIGTIAARLRREHDRLDELTVDTRGLRAQLTLSLDGLPTEVRTAFVRMALLPRTFPAFAIGALVDGTDGARLVETLVAAGLLECIGLDETGMLAYRPHDLVTLFARELLAGEETEETLNAGKRRLFDVLTTRCIELYEYPDITGGWLSSSLANRLPPNGADALIWLRVHADLVLAVLESGCDCGWWDQVGELAELVLSTMADNGYTSLTAEFGQRLHEGALAGGRQRTAWRAAYLVGVAVLQDDTPRAAELFGRSASAFAELNCPMEHAHALVEHAYALSLQGRLEMGAADQALDAALATGNDHVLSFVSRSYGDILRHTGQAAKAKPAYERAVVAAQRTGHPQLLQTGLRRLAGCLLDLDDVAGAAKAVHAAKQIRVVPKTRWVDAWTNYIEARLHLALGEPWDAIDFARLAVRAVLDVGSVRGTSIMVSLLCDAYLATGRPRVAERLRERLAAAVTVK